MQRVNMENIQQILIDSGLNELEANVYLSTLELGESTVLPIAKKAGLKRTYCYDILSSLANKGLVSYVQKNNRRRYQAADPKKIELLLKNRLENYQEALPQLLSIHNAQLGKPKVQFYEGKNGIISVYEQLFDTDKVDSIGSTSDMEKHLGVWLDNFSKKIITNKFIMRELIPQNETQANYHRFFKKPYQEIRFLPKGVQLKTDMMLFENKLALISYSSNLHAVVIEDSSIVDTQKALFEIIWKATEKATS